LYIEVPSGFTCILILHIYCAAEIIDDVSGRVSCGKVKKKNVKL